MTQRAGVRWFLVASLVASAAGTSRPSVAQDGDAIEGAVWRFTMTSKAGRGERRGAFRVNNHVLYQKDTPARDSTESVVGKDIPQKNPRRSVMEFTDLRVFTPERKLIGKMSGRVRMGTEERGVWTGEMVDGDGFHWEFRCVRIRE